MLFVSGFNELSYNMRYFDIWYNSDIFFSKDRSVYRSNAGKVRRPCWTVSISNQSAQSGSTSNFRFYFGIGKSEVSSRKLNGIRQWVEALRDK